ncbi:hypothetical protein LLT5_12850 [Lactococcus cremoris subsp. cremoris TIFN5]|nr:hypothetical protein LLT5_12850 [Lactococcus cremoris subsp. cremoris TIFN5]
MPVETKKVLLSFRFFIIKNKMKGKVIVQTFEKETKVRFKKKGIFNLTEFKKLNL